MVVPLLARRFVKYALRNIAPGASKAQKNLGVKSQLKSVSKKYEAKASKAYREKKPVRDRAMLQMADKIQKDITTLFGKKK